MKTIITRLWRSDEGATAIEYGLIAALISVALIAGATTLGGSINNTFGYVANKITASMQ